MFPSTVSPDVEPSEEALQELDNLLEELSRLGASLNSEAEYRASWLGHVTRALAAHAGIVWVPAANGLWHAQTVVHEAGNDLLPQLIEHAEHRHLLENVARSQRIRMVLPSASLASDVQNPTGLLLLLVPMSGDGETSAVAEILQRPDASPAAQEGYLRLLEAFAELADAFHQRQKLSAWKDRSEAFALRERFMEQLHASLDIGTVAATAANDARRLVGCDRVAVVLRQGGRERLCAVSGVDQLETRSAFARHTVQAAGLAIRSGETLCHGADAATVTGLDLWIESSQARNAVVVPLLPVRSDRERETPDDAVGAMTFEWFGGTAIDDACREQLEWVARQSTISLQRALEHRSIPLFSLWQVVGQAKAAARMERWPRWALALALVAAAIAALVFIPTELTVSGRGTLQPEVRRKVFAGADGLVSELLVDHGSACRKGDLLVQLTRSQLDFEFSRVVGELQTARTRLAVVQAARLDSLPQSAADRERYHQLAGEEEELKEQLTNLETQQAILQKQQDELKVRSPIDGVVITWNVRESLESRPVQRGQALLTVADLGGPWVLEIDVPDDKAGHVMRAQRTLGAALDVEFLLATDPLRTFHGTVEKFALSTDVGPTGPAQVLVTVRFDREQISQLRPGATVVPRIRCGPEPLGYVWFHSVWEALQKYVLF